MAAEDPWTNSGPWDRRECRQLTNVLLAVRRKGGERLGKPTAGGWCWWLGPPAVFTKVGVNLTGQQTRSVQRSGRSDWACGIPAPAGGAWGSPPMVLEAAAARNADCNNSPNCSQREGDSVRTRTGAPPTALDSEWPVSGSRHAGRSGQSCPATSLAQSQLQGRDCCIAVERLHVLKVKGRGARRSLDWKQDNRPRAHRDRDRDMPVGESKISASSKPARQRPLGKVGE